MDKRTDPTLTDYELGREYAKVDVVNNIDKVMMYLKFPNLSTANALGSEWARGYREYANAWLVINRA